MTDRFRSMGSEHRQDRMPDSWRRPGDDVSGAQQLAERLDRDHAAAPGDLQGIGTCRTCGLLIGRNGQGPWTHRPSVGEINAAEAWLDRHPPSRDGAPVPFDGGRSSSDDNHPPTIKETS
jgi:hypothetical protein